MTIQTIQPLKVRLNGQNQSLPAGEILTLIDRLGWNLLARVPEKVMRVDGGACFSCRSTRRWLSIHGAIICGRDLVCAQCRTKLPILTRAEFHLRCPHYHLTLIETAQGRRIEFDHDDAESNDEGRSDVRDLSH